MDFVVPADHRVKLKENEKSVPTPFSTTEKTKELESDGDTNCNWRTRYSHQRIGTGTGGLRNKGTSRDQSNYSIVTMNTEMSPGNLRRLAIT